MHGREKMKEAGNEDVGGLLWRGKVLGDMDSQKRKGIMELRRKNVFVTGGSLEGRDGWFCGENVYIKWSLRGKGEYRLYTVKENEGFLHNAKLQDW